MFTIINNVHRWKTNDKVSKEELEGEGIIISDWVSKGLIKEDSIKKEEPVSVVKEEVITSKVSHPSKKKRR